MAQALPFIVAGASVASSGVGAAGSAGAFGGGGGSPDITNISLNPRTRALQGLFARIVAQNVNTRPPGLLEDVASGGTSEFQLQNTGLTAAEAVQLGLIGRTGEIPMFTPGQSTLTPEQASALGREALAKERQATSGGRFEPFRRLARTEKRITKQQNRIAELSDKGVPEGRIARNRELLAKQEERRRKILERAGVQI